ncbi:hypothetical protein FOCC_FOCC013708 [Frankliniella occidentalis]|nr:hypothetical protein FOCC_FOCC013708 [Frankliniella occidentalis]
MKKAELIAISSDEMFEFLQSVCEKELTDDTLTFAAICTKVVEAHLSTGNVIAATFEFHNRSQLPGESIAEFRTALKKMAKPCEFGEFNDRAIRDRLVVGVRSMDTRATLFRGGARMTSEEAYQIAKDVEVSQMNAVKTENGHGHSVNKVSYSSKAPEKQTNNQQQKTKCWRCDRTNHKPNECRFINTVCRFCKTEGHIEKACISKKKGRKKQNNQHTGHQNNKVHQLSADAPNLQQEQKVVPNSAYSEAGPSWANEYSLGAMEAIEVTVNQIGVLNIPPPMMLQVTVDGRSMEFELDCGSPIALISEKTLRKQWPGGVQLEESPLKLATWTKSPVTIKGFFWVRVNSKTNSSNENMPLFVGYGEGTSLLGRQWFDFLGIGLTQGHAMVNKVKITELNKKAVVPSDKTSLDPQRYECFRPGLGEFKGKPITLKIDATIKPKRWKARKVPFARRKAVEEVINAKVASGVWKGPLQSAEYSTPIVAVFREKKLPRLCGDYRATANQLVKPDQYPMPTIEEAFSALSGGTIFSKIDLTDAYTQMAVDDEAAKLLTVATHKGLFSDWVWGTAQQNAFDEAKKMLCSAKVLVHYDLKRNLVVSGDASPVGVGAVIAHEFPEGEKPIEYASRALHKAEKNYSQTDREALSIVFAVKKWHNYLCGREFKIITDHKPLLGLFGTDKPMPTMVSPRMERWLIMMGCYKYTIEWRPGKLHGNCDALSRLCIPGTAPATIPEPYGVFLMTGISSPHLTSKQVAEATVKDTTLSKVMKWTQEGWPRKDPGDVEVSQMNAVKTENGHGHSVNKVSYSSKAPEKQTNNQQQKTKFCKTEGHIEKACISKKKGRKKQNNQHTGHQNNKVHQLSADAPNLQQEHKVVPNSAYSEAGPSWANEYSLGAMEAIEVTVNQIGVLNIPPPMMLQVTVDGRSMEFELDCGSPIALISEKTLRKQWPGGVQLEESPLKLATWTKSPVTIKGFFWVRVNSKTNSSNENMPLFVGYGEGTSLLGRQWFDFLGIGLTQGHAMVNKVKITELNKKAVVPSDKTSLDPQRYECFRPGLGEFKGKPITLKIDATIKPKRWKARKVPFARRKAVEEVINAKVASGVWKGPLQSAEYSTPIVAVFREKKLPRLCGDYRATANQLVKPDQYPMPTIEEAFSALSGGTIFSKIDLTDAYTQMAVDDEAAKLLTVATHKGLFSDWVWGTAQQNAFDEAKKMLCSAKVLVHYDLKRNLVVSGDASPVGVGAVIAHEFPEGEKPIEYASRALHKAEKNYSQTDREALSIVFAVKKWHNYLCGREFKIITDHKPLLGLFGTDKPMPTMVSPRMERWLIMMGCYKYTIEWRPGKLHGNCDALSRLCIPGTAPATIPEPYGVFLMTGISSPHLTSKQVAEATVKDTTLSKVMKWTQEGWPRKDPGGQAEHDRRRPAGYTRPRRAITKPEAIRKGAQDASDNGKTNPSEPKSNEGFFQSR